MSQVSPFLAVEDLVVDYGTVRAVDHVSLSVPRGGSLAVVGESGSGKSTLARAIVRLLKPASGRIVLDGTDLATLPERRLRPLRRRVQMVFQDPYGSLDPHLTAREIVAEPLRLAGVKDKAERRGRAAELLDRVGLPATCLDRRPGEFSGGQRQRIGIARALASDPDLLVCDEATSALDVSVQAQVLDLLRELQTETGITYIVIAHHLGVVREISTDVVVLQAGRVVERGRTATVLASPAEPYTRALRRAALDPTAIRGLKPRALAATTPPPHAPGTASPEPHASDAASPEPHASDAVSSGPHAQGAASPELHVSGAVSSGPHAQGAASPEQQASDAAAPEPHASDTASPQPHAPGAVSTEPHASDAASPEPHAPDDAASPEPPARGTAPPEPHPPLTPSPEGTGK